jgi:hypothetical protein
MSWVENDMLVDASVSGDDGQVGVAADRRDQIVSMACRS